MPTEIRYHLDEHVATAVASGLRRRGIDVTTTAEADLLGADDPDHLALALREGRVVVTHDSDFLSLARAQPEHAGICYCHQQVRSVRQIIEMLCLLHECYDAETMRNRIEYL